MDNLVNILSNTGIIIMPCDTIYGIVGIYPFSENKYPIGTVHQRFLKQEFLPFVLKLPSVIPLEIQDYLENVPGKNSH